MEPESSPLFFPLDILMEVLVSNKMLKAAGTVKGEGKKPE